MKDDVSKKRLAQAVSITAMLVLSVPAVGALADSGDALVAFGTREKNDVGALRPQRERIDAGTLIGNGDALGFLSRLEEASSMEDAIVPEAFEQEVGLPSTYRDLRVSDGGTVVSCLVDAPADFVAADMGLRMAAKGWSEVPLGSLEGATYVKADGQCTWALVTCTQVGDATNVVFRCVPR